MKLICMVLGFMRFFLLGTLVIFAFPVLAAPSRVGNGDDGSDLEGFSEIMQGPIFESREAALKLLNALNVSGVPGLGNLSPELENSKIHLTKMDVQSVRGVDSGVFHADMKGRVYARTFPEPHAATRFFPISEKLDSDQLISLHVHEALHRSLPASVREDEAVVTAITLSITSPGATFDGVNRVAFRNIPERDRFPERVSLQKDDAMNLGVSNRYSIPDRARVNHPSEFSYSYRRYRRGSQESRFAVDALHVLRSDLYPFGTDEGPVGIGIEASFIQRPVANVMGPLSLSGRTKAWSSRGFDVGFWGVASLNTLSNEELKQSQFGRDLFSLGLSMRKDLGPFAVENFLGYTLPSSTQQNIGGINYNYEYGGIVSASTHPAIQVASFRLGAFLEMNIGDYYRMSGGAYSGDVGRYRVLSGGPEVGVSLAKNLELNVSGRFVLDSTKDANFDIIGDLMGSGAGQGNIAMSIGFFY